MFECDCKKHEWRERERDRNKETERGTYVLCHNICYMVYVQYSYIIQTMYNLQRIYQYIFYIYTLKLSIHLMYSEKVFCHLIIHILQNLPKCTQTLLKPFIVRERFSVEGGPGPGGGGKNPVQVFNATLSTVNIW